MAKSQVLRLRIGGSLPDPIAGTIADSHCRSIEVYICTTPPAPMHGNGMVKLIIKATKLSILGGICR